MCKEACPDLEARALYVANGFTHHHPFLQGLHFRDGVCWCGRHPSHALHDQER